MPESVQRKLQQGDPASGWPGNPNMWIQPCDGTKCGKNKCKGRGWILCEAPRSGGTKVVMHNASSRVSESFLWKLAKAQKQTVDEMLAEVDKHNAELEKKIAAEKDELYTEGAERLVHRLKRDGAL